MNLGLFVSKDPKPEFLKELRGFGYIVNVLRGVEFLSELLQTGNRRGLDAICISGDFLLTAWKVYPDLLKDYKLTPLRKPAVIIFHDNTESQEEVESRMIGSEITIIHYPTSAGDVSFFIALLTELVH